MSSDLTSLGAIPFTSDTDQTLRWFGTIRGRLGFLPIDHLLIYGTGGFAYARIDQSASYTNTAPFSGLSSINGICMEASTCYAGTRGRTANGWTAGGGIEYALPNNWTIRAEYLYVKLDGPTNFDEIVIERQIGPASAEHDYGELQCLCIPGGAGWHQLQVLRASRSRPAVAGLGPTGFTGRETQHSNSSPKFDGGLPRRLNIGCPRSGLTVHLP